jgi:hypothetical protein
MALARRGSGQRVSWWRKLYAEEQMGGAMINWLQIKWFFDRASEFERAYHAVPETPPFSWPRYFLLCHSIELALKAWLVAHGTSEDDLQKKFGHDLIKLLEHAENCGLELEPDTQDAIKALAEAHKKHWARYPKPEVTRVFAIEQFEGNVTELLQVVGNTFYPPIKT